MPTTMNDAAVVALNRESETLIERIEKNIEAVPTKMLVPFYAKGDMIVKRICDLKEKVKAELVLKRFDEGTPFGEEGRHRRFEFDGGFLDIQERTVYKLDEAKAISVLKEKRLLEKVADSVVIEGAGPQFFRFLKAHAKELAAMGVEVRPQINEEKVTALVQLGELSLEDAASFMTEKTSYAAKVSLKK